MFRCLTLAALCLSLTLVKAQAGPNTLAQYNPSLRTMSSNSTFCIVPINKSDVQAIAGHAPLAIPSDILPSFPAGKHPLVLQSSYNLDIRMTPLNLIPLQIPALMQGSVTVPFVDVLNDGHTPINVVVNQYVGGINGQDVQAIVPSIAAGISPFEGTTTFPASFSPDTAAVRTLPGGMYSTQVKPYLLPNTISGPGVYAEAFDLLYSLTQSTPYTEHTFHALLNQPQLLNNGLCQRNTQYFNETFANPKMAVGRATLYHQILSTPPASIEGTYNDVYCYQANSVLVAAMRESCSSAAAHQDPFSQI